ncbi:hypothetical protein B9Z55_008802 [Caenorhabditis nigoni]|uniref:Uncharacterized protein n=1 Tax=Caenorhabditis nigoni TaxID=1611254 RepID=A0A2G5UP60_9PELO|nr:hypothetical protein B9Z55_008802 [Caenorhabditis nigoni]
MTIRDGHCHYLKLEISDFGGFRLIEQVLGLETIKIELPVADYPLTLIFSALALIVVRFGVLRGVCVLLALP